MSNQNTPHQHSSDVPPPTGAVNAPPDPLLMAHEADGIKELDNLLPRWWVWLFYLCTAFAVVYMVYYHVLRMGDLQAAQFDKDFKRGEQLKSVALAKFESSLSTLEPAKDEVILAKGH